jgi:hypothetical protein
MKTVKPNAPEAQKSPSANWLYKKSFKYASFAKF